MSDQTEPIQVLVDRLARLPGLGPRSARRITLHLLKRRNATMREVIEALRTAAEAVRPCRVCGSLDTRDPCGICQDPKRDVRALCVVEDVADVWALERARAFSGRYHVLGGTLNALDGVGPEDLTVESLVQRAAEPGVQEVILALSATVDGQVTAHYVAERLGGINVRVTRLAQGVPVGGELDYLDEGTLGAALAARRAFDSADPL
ncbi:MAG: recombination mediator RecR [Rhodospirillales bacterium]|nr:recombination mediator RecR [Rhodospirillales bacterium]